KVRPTTNQDHEEEQSATTPNGTHNFRMRQHHHVSKGCWFGSPRRTETTRTKSTVRVRGSVDIQRHGVHYISRYAPLALDDLCERGIPRVPGYVSACSDRSCTRN